MIVEASTATRGTRLEQTRARIVAAARAAFVADGYRSPSLREIATLAGLSHPGLLRHFGTKDELLAAVVAELEADNDALASSTPVAPDSRRGHDLPFAALAERNARVPGYLELFAALSGEACAAGHPAHAYMAARHARLRTRMTETIRAAADAGLVHPGRDAASESIRLAAAWDGLQVMHLYLGEQIDIPACLRRHQERLRSPAVGAPAATAPRGARGTETETGTGIADGTGSADDTDTRGYRTGRDRRARILDDTIALFARQGYIDTSLSEIAAAVGVSKSTLLHHYPSKAHLLRAVLAERDRRLRADDDVAPAQNAAAALSALPLRAADRLRTEPGLVETYAILSCEAIPPEHPAHEHMRQRYAEAISHFARMFRAAHSERVPSGEGAPGGECARGGDVDAVAEAIWLVALWDGLQFQWLYDADAVDVRAQLQAHLDDVLPISP